MATVREIARKAGISPAVVSRVFSNHGYVSKKSRGKVIQAARLLCHQPLEKNIAVIITEYAYFGGYAGLMLSACLENCVQRGYHAEIIQENSLHLLNIQPLYGAIAMVYGNGIERIWAATSNLPLVCVNTDSRMIDNIYSIHSDNRQGINLALDYFHAHGHHRIALVRDAPNAFFNRNIPDRKKREKDYLEWMKYHPTNNFQPLILESPDEVGRLIESHASAILIVGEGLLAFYSDAFNQHCLRIPEDISVIGFEGHDTLFGGNITTIGQNFDQLARQALDLLEQMNAGQTQQKEIAIPFLLHERKSVRSLLPE